MLDSAAIRAGTEARAAQSSEALPLSFADVTYAAGATTIIANLQLEFLPGAPTVLMGPNGCGKTTILKLAMGLIAPTSGRITYAGGTSAPPGSRSFVFQKPVMLRRSVAANIAFALTAAGMPAERNDIAILLELARISPLADRPARRLSGGEQQRLALARALARKPHVLFLDEPTASLDPASTRLVEEIIRDVTVAGVKVVMATHDLGQARRLAHDVAFLAAGRLVEHTPAAKFFADPASNQARRFLVGDLII